MLNSIWYSLVFLLIIFGNVLIESRPNSRMNTQTTSLSDTDAAALTSLGMSAAQIQSIFGSQIPESNPIVTPVIEGETDESSTRAETASSRDITMQAVEDEYEYESYDSDDDDNDMSVSIPNVGDTQGDELNNSDWKTKKEWWKDPLALFEEETTQPREMISQNSERVPEPNNNTIMTSITSTENVPPADSELQNLSASENPIATVETSFNSTSTDSVKSAPTVNSASQKSLIQSGSGALSISGLSLLYLQKGLSMSPTFFHVAVSYVIGKYAFFVAQKLKLWIHDRFQSRYDVSQKDENVQDTDQDTKDQDSDDLTMSEMEQFQDLGFGRSLPKRNFRQLHTNADTLGSKKSTIYDEGDQISQEKESEERSTKLGLWKWFNKNRGDSDEDSTSSKISAHETKNKAMPFSGKKQLEQEIKTLQEEIELLRETSLQAESQREKYQAENDFSRRELQGIRRQLEELSNTNKLLKAQLRDNSQSVTQAIQAERRKAEDDLVKVKAAMVRVLQRERNIMREHVKKILSNVRESMIAGEKENAENLEVHDDLQEED